MKRYIYKFVGLIAILTWLVNLSYAQPATWNAITGFNPILCETDTYKIEWFANLKVDVPVKYVLFSNFEIPTKNISWQVMQLSWEQVVFTSSWSTQINFTPDFVGDARLILTITYPECEVVIQKPIHIFKDIYTYVGEQLPDRFKSTIQSYKDQNIYFHIISLPSSPPASFDVAEVLRNNKYYLMNATKLVISHPTFFVNVLDALQRLDQPSFLKNTELYLIYEGNPNIIKGFIGVYIKKLGIKNIYLVPQEQALNVLVDLASPQVSKFAQPFGGEDFSRSYFRIVSVLIDFLLYRGFPFDLLTLMFVIALWALVVAIFRQIIWFCVYWLYTPLMFAISVYLIWWKVALFLLLIGIISKILINFFNSRLYLLYSAKISLYITLYFVLFLFSLWLLFITWLLRDNSWISFRQEYVIFPLIFIWMTADKIYTETSRLFSFKWWGNFLEFLFVSRVLVLIISSKSIQYFLISYPELILLMMLANIFVGRFTWLQLMEYRRFLVFIKRHMEEEE